MTPDERQAIAAVCAEAAREIADLMHRLDRLLGTFVVSLADQVLKMGDPGCESAACHEGVAVYLVRAGLILAFGAAEGVDRLADHHVGETAVLQHLLPARTGPGSRFGVLCPRADGRVREGRRAGVSRWPLGAG